MGAGTSSKHGHGGAPQVMGVPVQENRTTATRDDAAVLSLTCRDQFLPPDIRLGFVLKVYGVLAAMLAVTFAIALPFIFFTSATLAWFQQHAFLLYLVIAVLVAQHVFNLCMMCQLCCGRTGLLDAYLRMFRTVPWNYIYLTVYALAFGVVVGYVCAQYSVQSVLYVFALSLVLIAGLTAYAVRTKADFTGYGPFIMVIVLGFLGIIIVGTFLPVGSWWTRVIGAAGATLFGFLIVQDTQLIFGSASGKFGATRMVEYTIDMYAFAAFNLYLDFINFFLYLLMLLGQRDS